MVHGPSTASTPVTSRCRMPSGDTTAGAVAELHRDGVAVVMPPAMRRVPRPAWQRPGASMRTTLASSPTRNYDRRRTAGRWPHGGDGRRRDQRRANRPISGIAMGTGSDIAIDLRHHPGQGETCAASSSARRIDRHGTQHEQNPGFAFMYNRWAFRIAAGVPGPSRACFVADDRRSRDEPVQCPVIANAALWRRAKV